MKSVAVAVVVIVIASLGCGSFKSMMSEVKDAKVACAKCQPGMAVAVGAPLKLELTWKRCSSLDRKCQADVPPFKVDVSCDGVACETTDTGGGYYEVTPKAAGTATVVVRLEDQKQRVERLGPFTVVAMDGILLACTYIAPGGGAEQRAPCGDHVPPNSDLYVEIVARAGDRRLANPLPRDVAVNGRLIYEGGQMTRDAAWTCKASIDSSDASVPAVTKCTLPRAPAGATWTLEARLPDQTLTAGLTIKVARK